MTDEERRLLDDVAGRIYAGQVLWSGAESADVKSAYGSALKFLNERHVVLKEIEASLAKRDAERATATSEPAS